MKFNRTYRLTIRNIERTESITIEPPFTLQFSVVRGIGAVMNTGNFLIYNLSKNTRYKIFADRFVEGQKGQVILEAGYEGQLSTVFVGDIYEASSLRQGANIITNIVARDGGYDTTNIKTSTTFAAGTSTQEIVKSLIGEMPNLNQGAIAGDNMLFLRPVTVEGNTWQQIQTYSNYKAFVDLGVVNVLGDNEAIKGLVVVIDSATGLLETPRREDAALTVKMLFEPKILMGQVVELKSSINPLYDGQYKVVNVKHSGIISEAVNGQCESEFSLLLASQIFKTLKIV